MTALGSWTDRVIALRSRTNHVIALRQVSVTALLYLENSKRIHPLGVRACQPKDANQRMVMFPTPPATRPGPALCKLG